MKSCYLQAAKDLADYCRGREGDTLAAVDFLDRDPEARFQLEDTLTGSSGEVYREVPDYLAGDFLPFHLKKARIKVRRLFKERGATEDKAIEDLFVVLKDLYATPGKTAERGLDAVVKEIEEMVTGGSEVPVALFEVTNRYKMLVDELPTLEEDMPTVDVERGLTCKGLVWRDYIAPRVPCYSVFNGEREELEDHSDPDLHELFEGDLKGTGCGFRKEILHDPNGRWVPDWLEMQGARFVRAFNRLRQVGMPALQKAKRWLIELTEASEDKREFSRLQLKILWCVYRERRDYLRRIMMVQAGKSLGDVAAEMVRRINLVDESGVLGGLGKKLYDFSKKGHPKVTEGEMSFVWSVYRTHKAELKDREVSQDAWMYS